MEPRGIELTDKSPKEAPIIVVSLDISKLDADYKQYAALPALAKINRIEKYIEEVYKQIQTRSPGAWIVISWREFGIFDPSERSIDGNGKESSKAKLKQMLQRVTEHRPFLQVIAGPTLIRKTVTKAKVRKTKIDYQELTWIDDSEMEKHESNVDDLLYHSSESDIHTQFKTASFAIVAGEVMLRHAKIAPFYEEDGFGTNPSPFFRPGKGRSNNPTFNFKNAPLLIAVEICYENWVSSLKHCAEKKMEKKIDLQFILSASADVKLDSTIAEDGVIHIDSVNPTEHILPKGKRKPDKPICLYRCNLLQDEVKIEGPIKPVIPLQYEMEYTFKALQNQWIKEHRKIRELNELHTIIKTYHNNTPNFYPHDKSVIPKLIEVLDKTKKSYFRKGLYDITETCSALIILAEKFNLKYAKYIPEEEPKKKQTTSSYCTIS